MSFFKRLFGGVSSPGSPAPIEPSSPSLDRLLADMENKTPAIKASAVMSLSMLDESAVDPLLKRIRTGKTPATKWAAAEALGIIGSQVAVQPLCESLKSEQEAFLFGAIVRALGKIADERAVDTMVPLLDTFIALAPKPDPNDPTGLRDRKRLMAVFLQGYVVRKRLVEALGALRDSRAVPVLVKALDDDELYVVSASAQALVEIGDSGVAALIATLERRSKADAPAGPVSPNQAERQPANNKAYGITSGLERATDKRLVPVLISLLQDSDWRVRRDAARALGNIGDPLAVEELRRNLSDVNPEVRAAVAQALEGLGDRSGLDSLIELLSSKQDENARRAAVRALGKFGGARVTEILTQILEDPKNSEETRLVAAWTLGTLGNRKGFELLLKSLSSKQKEVRRDAAKSLGEIKDDQSVESLAKVLGDPEEEVRLAAACSLANLGDMRCFQVLNAILLTADMDRKLLAIEALGQISHLDSLASLVLSLRGSSGSVRNAIVSALAKFGSAAKESMAPLLLDPRLLVRNDAQLVVDRIAAEVGNAPGSQPSQPSSN